MRFFFDDKALQGHPCVSKVDRFKLVLNTDLRVQMYKVWRENQSPSVIAQMLQANGLGPFIFLFAVTAVSYMITI